MLKNIYISALSLFLSFAAAAFASPAMDGVKEPVIEVDGYRVLSKDTVVGTESGYIEMRETENGDIVKIVLLPNDYVYPPGYVHMTKEERYFALTNKRYPVAVIAANKRFEQRARAWEAEHPDASVSFDNADQGQANGFLPPSNDKGYPLSDWQKCLGKYGVEFYDNNNTSNKNYAMQSCAQNPDNDADDKSFRFFDIAAKTACMRVDSLKKDGIVASLRYLNFWGDLWKVTAQGVVNAGEYISIGVKSIIRTARWAAVDLPGKYDYWYNRQAMFSWFMKNKMTYNYVSETGYKHSIECEF